MIISTVSRLVSLARFLSVFCLCLFYYPLDAGAVLKIDITRGNGELLAIKLADFNLAGSGPQQEKLIADQIGRIIKNNLIRTGLFAVSGVNNVTVDDRAMPEEGWKSKLGGVGDALFTSSVRYLGDDQVEVKFRLWDVVAGKQMAGKLFTANLDSIRRTSHMISDHMYHLLTGEKGYFDTRIAYVAEMGGVKRIALMDQDGANNIFLTDGRNLVLSPRFSPNAQKIVYMSYASGTARIYMRDIETGKEEMLGNYRGVHSAPRFAPKGRKVLMSRSLNGVTDIYEINLVTRKRKKLTVKTAINTSGSFSPDESKIVFNSDRGGRPQIYVMNADGSRQRRLSFGEGSYATPVWSPRGDWIAFTKILDRTFHLGVMKPDGSGERLIAKGYLVASPTWSPNGRVVMFEKNIRSGSTVKSRIHFVDLTGSNERPIPTNPAHKVYDPSWSPLLPESARLDR